MVRPPVGLISLVSPPSLEPPRLLFLAILPLLAPGVALAVVEGYSLTAVVPVVPGLWVVDAAMAEVAVGLAHLSLSGLVSVFIITESGPYSVVSSLVGVQSGSGYGERS